VPACYIEKLDQEGPT